MLRNTTRLTVLIALAAASSVGQANDPLATLRKQHPRLIALDSDIARIRKLRPGSVETDEQEEAIELYSRRRKSESDRG